jgi:hypothetical protein
METKVTISKVIGREIIDSRGNPTVEADVFLSDGTMGRASVPSGASTGKFEALELRDKDSKRYRGAGVLKAVENINKEIGNHLIGMNPFHIENIDKKLLSLDGTKKQRETWSKRHISPFPCHLQSRSQFSKATPLSIYWRHLWKHNAPTYDEHIKWWSPCFQQFRHSRIYDNASGRKIFFRRIAMEYRSIP